MTGGKLSLCAGIVGTGWLLLICSWNRSVSAWRASSSSLCIRISLARLFAASRIRSTSRSCAIFSTFCCSARSRNSRLDRVGFDESGRVESSSPLGVESKSDVTKPPEKSCLAIVDERTRDCYSRSKWAPPWISTASMSSMMSGWAAKSQSASGAAPFHPRISAPASRAMRTPAA